MKLVSSPLTLLRPARGRAAAILPACATVLASILVSIAPARAQNAPAAEPDAKVILMQMANFMSTLPSFSVDVRDAYDSVQTSGQKIEYGETRKITVARPDRMRIDSVESDGDRQTLIIDAKDITLFSQPANVFAQTPSPGSLDQAIVRFVRDLGMRLPFAALLLSSAPADIERRTKTLDYVETTSILGAPAHHIAGRTDGVDYQIWIADGDKPLPLRLVLTYTDEQGEPQFRAQFSDWKLAPQLTDATFAFTPPPGARRIAFLAEMPRSVAPAATKATTATTATTATKSAATVNAGEKK